MNDTPDDPKDKEIEEVEEIGPEEGAKALMGLKEIAPTVEKKWLRKNISFNRYWKWTSLHNCD